MLTSIVIFWLGTMLTMVSLAVLLGVARNADRGGPRRPARAAFYRQRRRSGYSPRRRFF